MTKSTTSDNGKGKKNTSPSKNIRSTDCSITRVPKSIEQRMHNHQVRYLLMISWSSHPTSGATRSIHVRMPRWVHVRPGPGNVASPLYRILFCGSAVPLFALLQTGAIIVFLCSGHFEFELVPCVVCVCRGNSIFAFHVLWWHWLDTGIFGVLNLHYPARRQLGLLHWRTRCICVEVQSYQETYKTKVKQSP